MVRSFYWHDYETWGVDPSIDRPSQFAGVRTDENLNIISEPLVIYCQPSEDVLPHPEACLVTGITPQHAIREGVSEKEFAAKIYRELAEPGTCGVGYNSLRFDDEVTRYMLFRNFYDPYEREWQNNNSRWDIIDMVRLVYALRPEGIEWPIVEGKPSFKLENLTMANSISHAAAHDAYSDVEATISLAKLIKTKKAALYDYVLQNKSKQSVAQQIDIKKGKPLLHISSKFPSERGCAGLVLPLAMHPVNKNAVIAYELSVDPTPLRDLSAEQIRDRVFVSQQDLPEAVSRLPIKLIHLNKCPVLVTPKLLDEAAAKRLGIDKTLCEKHWQLLRKFDVSEKLREMYLLDSFTPTPDPETQLYNGFINNKDKALMREVRRISDEDLADSHFVFEDKRLQEIYGRYQARNGFKYLTEEDQQLWQDFVFERLANGDTKCLSIDQLLQHCEALKSGVSKTEDIQIIQQLEAYAIGLKNKYRIAHENA